MSKWKTLQPLLERFAIQEMSAVDIAKELTKVWGVPITKNAVIGRAYRTNVQLRDKIRAMRESGREVMSRPGVQAKMSATRKRNTLKKPAYPCGHPRIPDNTYVRPLDGGRVCKACIKARYERNRATA